MSDSTTIFKNKTELITKAKEQANMVENDHKQSVYLYFITRYFVSLFEARFGEISIQVWNEYRNALDHYFRHLTQENTNNLSKMEGHLQRAALDIMKFYCHKAKDRLVEEKNHYSRDILSLVDNGVFYPTILKGVHNAEELFMNAKTFDSSLGEDAKTNENVLDQYMEALFSFDEVYRNFIEKIGDIENAERSHSAITDKAEKGTFWEHMKTHYIFYISWTVIAGSAQYIYNHGLVRTYNNISSLLAI
ncbi:MAG: hypothetical protein U9O24_01505 [Campylobacterota bacterium]|nr:hypothetical protein [Campylobacterota bacterium]